MIIFFFGCTDRDRTNPLDPSNPNTDGRPTGLSVYSIGDRVFLEWDEIDVRDITGYNIYRKSGNDSDFAEISSVPVDQNRYTDSNLQFEVGYQYRISAVGENFESLTSEAVTITPGPTLTWVADNLSQSLVKLSHDSRHVIERVRNIEAVKIVPNSRTGDVWVIDFFRSFTGNLLKVIPSGEIEFSVDFSPGALTDIDVDSVANRVWVADSLSSRVLLLNSNGQEIFTISGFSRPFAVSVDQRNGQCWVADRGKRRVIRVFPDQQQVDESDVVMNDIRAIDFSEKNGIIWVVDGNRLVRLNESGDFVDEIFTEFQDIRNIAINENTGAFWILNFNPSIVSKYTATGLKLFEVGDLTRPRDIAVNLTNNSCLIADSDNNRLIKVAETGTVVSILNIGFPDAVAVQY